LFLKSHETHYESFSQNKFHNFILLLMFIHVVKNIDLQISTFAKLTDCLVQGGEINSEVMIHDESICKLDGKLLM
jgi:hypothetical protein